MKKIFLSEPHGNRPSRTRTQDAIQAGMLPTSSLVSARLCGLRAIVMSLFFASTLAVAASDGAAPVPLPKLTGPLPVTAESYPFNAMSRAAEPVNISASGYVEEEFLIEGRASIYDSPSAGELIAVASGPYVSRILVRRPADRSRFTGVVIVEPLNPSAMVDAPLMWNHSYQHFMARGYAWVGITVKPVAARALERFDPQRYARISFANPRPEGQRCPDAELGGDRSDEVGLAFDIISQVGALVRSDDARNPLGRASVERVYLTGYSQTAGYAIAYANMIAPFARREGNAPMFDGYLEAGNGPFSVPLNGCVKPFVRGEKRLLVDALGVPFIDIAPEGDVLHTRFMAKKDSDTPPDLYRHYEVAGATHVDSWLLKLAPTDADAKRAGGRPRDLTKCTPSAPAFSDHPLRYTLNAAWDHLEAWVTRNEPPPRAEPLKTEGSEDQARFVKDAHGNTLGGVRSVAVDVPTAVWHGSRQGCPTFGYAEPFSAEKLAAEYSSTDRYVARVEAAVEKLRAARWLTEEDARRELEQARKLRIP